MPKQLFDISDYLDACVGRRGITGIQRVQECIVRELLDHAGGRLFVMVDPRYGRVWALDHSGLTKLVNRTAGTSTQCSLEEQGLLAETLRDSARLQRLAPNDLLVNLGCFWAEQYRDGFKERMRSLQCRLVPLIYDLIPIDNPELCVTQTAQDFNTALPSTIRYASALITISRHTKLRLEAFGLATALPMPPTYVVPLAHQLIAISSTVFPVGLSDAAKSGQFVLSVGTFEPRKNQLRLAEAWAMLANDIANMPVLVIAGKIGWLDLGSMTRLTELSRTSGKIILVHDISDCQLAALYCACLFTVFLSIDEGWGLPVGESLANGKICLASNAGAIPEAGNKFAVYVNPTDITGIINALRSLIVDESYRHQLESDLRQGFRARTWVEVANDIVAAALQIQNCAPLQLGILTVIGP